MNEVRLATPQGASASISLFGAHLMSWRTADGKERLFMSSRALLDGSTAIRGGVPVIFPQFNQRGPGQRHGFARTSTWRLAAQGADWAELVLAPQDLAPVVAQAWPHAFEARLRFALRGDTLDMRFTVRNSGSAAFDFGGALHTYFALDEFNRAVLHGLRDTPELHFADALDEACAGTAQLRLESGAGTLLLQQEGFSEWVVWNPGAEGAAATRDLAPGDERRFVCIEPACVEQRPLAAGAEWAGHHSISLIP